MDQGQGEAAFIMLRGPRTPGSDGSEAARERCWSQRGSERIQHPVLPVAWPRGPEFMAYRSLTWGKLLCFFFLSFLCCKIGTALIQDRF